MSATNKSRQFSTFYVADRLYGIDVMQVQEVTKTLPLTCIRLAPDYVKGLINLRGQIATAVGLRELFQINSETSTEKMTVVCRHEDVLLSLLVDRIGDVIEVSDESFERSLDTIDESISKFMQGVYKVPGAVLSVIEVEKIFKTLNKKGE